MSSLFSSLLLSFWIYTTYLSPIKLIYLQKLNGLPVIRNSLKLSNKRKKIEVDRESKITLSKKQVPRFERKRSGKKRSGEWATKIRFAEFHLIALVYRIFLILLVIRIYFLHDNANTRS